ncbi:MAG: hypothetical protein JKY66_09035 [Spongiibacteraceae bacterium]|nr:hypothetical protein [Spongiibacteraceae bacterium]
MPYVHRDNDGKILLVSQEKLDQCDEWLEEGSQELENFLKLLRGKEHIEKTDLSFVRVLEDVIDLLIAKNTILLTELPSMAQKKIAERQHLRKALRPCLDILDEEDGGLI